MRALFDMNDVHPQFFEVKTSDGLTLPGLLYEPANPKAVVIFLHGNGSSSVFYNEKSNRVMASALQKKGIAILYFNNRGAHVVKRLNVVSGKRIERRSFGMAYEKIRDCIPDIDGAISCLKKRGYNTFYLMGASTGANKICVYHFYKPKNNISKNILLCGGDDVGIYYHELGKKMFWNLLKRAKDKIQRKQGHQLVKELIPKGMIFSYAGFYDIANPDGDYNVFPFLEVIKRVKLSKKRLFRHIAAVKKPTFVVYGDQDEYAWGNVPRVVDILKKQRPDFDYALIKGANHSFSGHEQDCAKQVANWL